MLRELLRLFLLLGSKVARSKATGAFPVDFETEHAQVRSAKGDGRVALKMQDREKSVAAQQER